MISPGKACNLRCVGCYANSGAHRERLDWATFERTVREAYETWGTRAFVISGGEPLAWRDGSRSFLDLAERFPDCFFIMYTNGTLIDDAVAKRLGRMGNVSPALSIEGMKERTDARRGDGVFDKVLAAMERLKREGVITGVSLTATRLNSDEILSDEVVETFFDRIGASYAFVFHYMPIGRSFTLDLMMTPEQRLRLFERVWWLVRNRHIFIADFWNSATATNGCLAAGRAGGYFHVNWNGDVSPCVFFPYSPVNVKEVFAREGRSTRCGRTPSSPTSGAGSASTATARRTSRARTAGTGSPRASSATTTRRSWSWCAGTSPRRSTRTRGPPSPTPSTTPGSSGSGGSWRT